MAGHQKACVTKCKPMEGCELVCNCCGEPKPYADFHDYREASYGRILRKCKDCHNKANIERYHKEQK